MATRGPTLSVWKFSTPHGADAAEYTVRELERAGHIVVHDAAVLSWQEGDNKPHMRQVDRPETKGALHGSFWGLAVGTIFLAPVVGAAVGAAVGGLRGSLKDVGIDDAFVAEVRREVVPGTSALFVLTSDAVFAEVAKAFAGQEHQLLSTNLSADQEQQLQQLVDHGPGSLPTE
jgi:uncharacterized membrane protein